MTMGPTSQYHENALIRALICFGIGRELAVIHVQARSGISLSGPVRTYSFSVTFAELSTSDIGTIRRDGICLKPQFFSQDEVRELHSTSLRMREYSVSNSKEPRRWILISPIDVIRKSIKPHGYKDIKLLSEVSLRGNFREFASRYMSGEVHLDHVLSIESPPSPKAITAWHTDANSEGLHEDFFTLKFFIYLNDITVDNGAFAYLRGSHRLVTNLRRGINQQMIPYVRTASPRDLLNACEITEVRMYLKEEFSETEIEWLSSELSELKDDQPGDSTYDLAGPAGTLLVFDDRGVHRGGIPTDGHRSILRYCYALNEQVEIGYRHHFVNRFAKQLLPRSIRANW